MSEPVYDELLDKAEAQMPEPSSLADGTDSWESAVRRLLSAADEVLFRSRAEHGALEAALLDRFADAIDALELLRLLSRSVARLHEAAYAPQDADAVDWEEEALRQLFWTGQLVSREILVLLRSGYAAGALTRWRALHEVAVRSEVLALAGPQTAERYLAHEEIREQRLQRRLSELLTRAGSQTVVDEAEVQAAEAREKQLVQRFGEPFRAEYGWAHEYLLEVSASYRKRCRKNPMMCSPTFIDLARAARKGRDPLLTDETEIDYGFANLAAHASPASARDAAAPALSAARVGPSAQQMNAAAIPASKSLADLTFAYCGRDLDDDRLDRLIWLLDAARLVAIDLFGDALDALE